MSAKREPEPLFEGWSVEGAIPPDDASPVNAQPAIAALLRERDRLKARLAELEAAIKSASK